MSDDCKRCGRSKVSRGLNRCYCSVTHDDEECVYTVHVFKTDGRHQTIYGMDGSYVIHVPLGYRLLRSGEMGDVDDMVWPLDETFKDHDPFSASWRRFRAKDGTLNFPMIRVTGD